MSIPTKKIHGARFHKLRALCFLLRNDRTANNDNESEAMSSQKTIIKKMIKNMLQNVFLYVNMFISTTKLMTTKEENNENTNHNYLGNLGRVVHFILHAGRKTSNKKSMCCILDKSGSDLEQSTNTITD